MRHMDEYHPSRRFRKSQAIHHPAFNDPGRILKIEHSSHGMQRMLVEFERHGTRWLIAGRA